MLGWRSSRDPLWYISPPVFPGPSLLRPFTSSLPPMLFMFTHAVLPVSAYCLPPLPRPFLSTICLCLLFPSALPRNKPCVSFSHSFEFKIIFIQIYHVASSRSRDLKVRGCVSVGGLQGSDKQWEPQCFSLQTILRCTLQVLTFTGFC